jgi:hypothetical protein
MYITQISYTIFLTTHIRGDCRLDGRLLLIEINKNLQLIERLDAFSESAAKRLI